MIKMIMRMIAPWRLNREPVTILRGDQLAVGMVLSPHNDGMGVRPAGERISGVEPGDECGVPVVYVRSSAHYGVWPIRASERITVVSSSCQRV